MSLYMVWSRDFSEVLLVNEDSAVVKQYYLDSGEEWLPIVVHYDNQSRWSGRIDRIDGEVVFFTDYGYLKYLLEWPEII